MNTPKRSIELAVWGALIVAMLAVCVSFVASRLRDQRTPQTMAVLGAVPAFALTNQSGQRITLEDFQGRVWVGDIIFTRCPGPCAKMTRQMATLQDALKGEDQVRFLSLTADPGHDTPEVLKRYAGTFGADSNRWHFLTGDKLDLYRLATRGLLLAVDETDPATRESPNDLFVHSTRFVIVDRQGRIRGAFDGTDPAAVPQMLKALRHLLKE